MRIHEHIKTSMLWVNYKWKNVIFKSDLNFFQIFAMQEEQYKAMLQEAEASVVHMTEVVNKYQVQVKKRKKERVYTI